MTTFNPASPIGFLMLVLGTRLDRARDDERGASAVEWIVISAILVGIVLTISVFITQALTTKATEVGNDIQSG